MLTDLHGAKKTGFYTMQSSTLVLFVIKALFYSKDANN